MQLRAPRSFLLTVGLCTALVGISLPVTQALASSPRVVEAAPASLPTSATLTNTPLTTSFDVTLASAHPEAEQAFIASLYNTASANYHHFLTPTSFAATFGATPASIANLTSYFESFGLTVSALSTSHVTMKVTGRTPAISRALDAHVASVRVAPGTLVAALTSSASLPADLASSVTAISGLSAIAPDSTSLKTAHAATPVAPSTCSATGSPTANVPSSQTDGSGYNVQQEAQLYNLSPYWAKGINGTGETVALYELAAYDSADVSSYFSCYGISPTITAIPVDGGAASGIGSLSGNGTIEATMDVEELGALAPGAALEVYETADSGTGPTDEYQKIADDNSASIVSTSWGQCELDPSGNPSAELPIFEQMAAQGQTVISAAGDSGSTDCSGDSNVSLSAQNAVAADDPASQPWVTGVGGLLVSQISPLTETVWNEGANSGSAGGGGMSTLWSRPSWQNASGITSSDTMRMEPDLSVIASQESGFIAYITESSNGICPAGSSGCGWQVVGGTSIGAPLVSALVATASENCGSSRLGFINPTLYANQATAFNDVTTGSNDLTGGQNYEAAAGYDMASGLGSPSAQFIADLCPPAFSQAKSTFTSDKTATTDDAGANVTATLNDVNGTPITNAHVTVNLTSSSGTLEVDNDPSSSQSSGAASYVITTDASGAAAFNVTSSAPGTVKVSVTYQGTIIYTTSIAFSQTATTTTTTVPPTTTTTQPKNVPGAPSIVSVLGLSGAVSFTVAQSTKLYTGTILDYQYSVDGGKTWITLPTTFSGTTTVKGLAHKHTYSLVVRVQSSTGNSPTSTTKKVVTK